jgi:hypothetical protein
MFSEAQRAAFARATELLTELSESVPGWSVSAGVRSYFCPWGPHGHVGLRARGAAALVTADTAIWFRTRGWVACAFEGDALVAPLVEAAPPAHCYHTTPAVNEDGIRRRGLLRGVEAGRSTTGRPDAGQRIHITFDPDDAAQWAEDRLLGKHHPDQEWVVFEISRRGIVGKVFRDPASQTGYILECDSVAPEFLKPVRRWRPDVGTCAP